MPWLVIGIVALGVFGLTRIKPSTGALGIDAVQDPTYLARWATRISGEGEERSPMMELSYRIKSGMTIPGRLVEACMVEAYELGDVRLLTALHRKFPVIASQMQSSPTKQAPTPSKSDAKNPDVVVGKNSPIYGVSNDEWDEFIGKLKQHEPAFKDERHVGMFHHSRKRLSDLGIDPETLGDEASQYGALESDLRDVLARHKKLVNDFSGDSVTINGQTISITRSGILGLVKHAGIEGAKSWLTNEADRTRYPYTTQAFLHTNGLF